DVDEGVALRVAGAVGRRGQIDGHGIAVDDLVEAVAAVVFVGAGAADEEIVAVVAADGVVADAAVDGVVAGAAAQRVVQVVADDVVVELVAGADQGGADQDEVFDLAGRDGRGALGRRGQGVVDRGLDSVVALALVFIHLIGGVADDIGIVAGAAVHLVVAGAAVELVVAAEAVNRVVLAVAIEDVVVGAADAIDDAVGHAKHPGAGLAGVAGSVFQIEHLAFNSGLRQLKILAVNAGTGCKSGAGGETVADVAGGPIDGGVTENDVEVAGAFVDQFELKCVQLVSMLIVVADVLPCHRKGAVSVVLIVPDHAASGRPRVNVGPKRRNDWIGPVGDCVGRELRERAFEGDVAVIVDVQARV